MFWAGLHALRSWRRRRKWRRNGVVVKRACLVTGVDFQGAAILEDRCRLIGDPKIVVGENFYANVDCHFLGEITFGNDVSIGPKTVIWGRDHRLSRGELIRRQGHIKRPIRIGDDVWIGAQCTILKGVTVGSGAVIGAGSVVVEDIPEYAIVVGNPARVARFRQWAAQDDGGQTPGCPLEVPLDRQF